MFIEVIIVKERQGKRCWNETGVSICVASARKQYLLPYFFFLLSLFDFQNSFKNQNWMFSPDVPLLSVSSLFLLDRFHSA